MSFTLPSWIPADAWAGFVEMRKKIKAPLTDYGKYLIVGKLMCYKDAGMSPKDILEQSIERSWRGVFPLKDGALVEEMFRSPSPEVQCLSCRGFFPKAAKHSCGRKAG